MKQYIVTGMSCAVCQARVEKAVAKVPGVTGVSVSLLTNSMGVEGSAAPEEVIRAVEQAGYGASVKGEAAGGANAGNETVSGRETAEERRREPAPGAAARPPAGRKAECFRGGGGSPEGSGNAEAEKTADSVRGLPGRSDVYHHGVQHVGMAAAGLFHA